jgi:hypothetical protein
MEEEEDESDWDNEDTSIVASSPYPNKFTDYEDTVAPPVELFFDFEEHILYLSDLDIEELNEGLLFQDDLDEEERTFSTIVSILGFKSQVEAIEAFILEKKESLEEENISLSLELRTSSIIYDNFGRIKKEFEEPIKNIENVLLNWKTRKLCQITGLDKLKGFLGNNLTS